MVRLILVLAPALCMLSGIGVSEFMHSILDGFFDKEEIHVEIETENFKEIKE